MILTQEVDEARVPDVEVLLGLAEARSGPGSGGADDAVHARLAVGFGGVPAVQIGFLQPVAPQVHHSHLGRPELAFACRGGGSVALHAREDGLVPGLDDVHDRGAAEVEE